MFYVLFLCKCVLYCRRRVSTQLQLTYISYHISYHIYRIVSYRIVSHHIVSYHIISYHIISYHIISYHIISYHIISYHIISYHIISFIVSYHIIRTSDFPNFTCFLILFILLYSCTEQFKFVCRLRSGQFRAT